MCVIQLCRVLYLEMCKIEGFHCSQLFMLNHNVCWDTSKVCIFRSNAHNEIFDLKNIWPAQPKWNTYNCIINQSDDSKGTHTFCWAITSHGCATSWEKHSQVNLHFHRNHQSLSQSVSVIPLLSSSIPTHILSSRSPLCFWYLPRRLFPPMSSSFSREVGFPRPFACLLVLDLRNGWMQKKHEEQLWFTPRQRCSE